MNWDSPMEINSSIEQQTHILVILIIMYDATGGSFRFNFNRGICGNLDINIGGCFYFFIIA
jgi:hypothetical protein